VISAILISDIANSK